MKQLAQHIEYLLIRRECVILPGVGAFIATRKNARIDADSETLLPPTREISFNPEVKTDDGMLAHSVARYLGCHFERGREVVKSSIEHICEELDSRGSVMIGNLGTLSKNEGRLRFTPLIDSSRLERMSGFKPISLVEPEDSSAVEEKFMERSDSRYYVIRIPKRLARGVAAALASILVTLSVLLPSAERQSETMVASVVPVEHLVNNSKPEVAKDRIAEEGGLLVANPVVAAGVDSENGEKAEAEEGQERFFLIVGTFATEKGAEKYRAMRASAGDDLEICKGRNGICRVSYARGEREALQAMMNDRAFQRKYPGAWIWERK